MTRFRIFGLAGAAVLALALNGCGSSDERPMEPPPTPVEMAASALEMAEAALEALPADATEAQRLAAQEKVLEAAKAHLEALEGNVAAPHREVTKARMAVADAQSAVDATQMRIADSESEPTALDSAEMALSDAATALAAAEAEATTTDAMLLEAQEAVEDAAKALLALLAADADTPHGAVDAVRMTIAEIEAAIMVTEGRIGAAEMTAAAAEKAAAAAEKAIADARTALTAAKAAVDALDEDATHMEKLAAQNAVLMAAEAVVAALGDAAARADTAAVTMAQAAVDALNERITTADVAALAAAVSKNLSTLTGGPFRASATSGRNYVVGVERMSGAAAAVTVTDQNGTVTHTADDEKLGAGDAPPAINKYWSGSGFQRGNEYVAVYTDIETPTPIPFFAIEENGGRYTSADATQQDPTHSTLRLVTSDTASTDAPLSLWGGNPTVLEAAPTGTHRIEFEDDDTTENVDEDAFKGTYDGASGEFECTVALCALTIDSKGAVTAAEGSWNFTPDAGATVDEPDADYLWFGYWLRTAANDDGTSTYSFQADSDGSLLYDSNDISVVKGSAKYVGAAGGMYMQKEVNPDGSFDPATGVAKSGMFTATATLDANFGGSSVAADDAFTISGTISDFMDGEDNLGWTAKLMNVNFGRKATFSGLTEGNDSKLDHGEWNGAFYDNAVSNPPVNDNQPFGIAGEFNAHFTNGHVHGAYGASIVED